MIQPDAKKSGVLNTESMHQKPCQGTEMRNSKIELMVLKAKVEFLEQVLLHRCNGDQRDVAHAKDVVSTKANSVPFIDRSNAREIVTKTMLANGKLKNPWSGMNLAVHEKRRIAKADLEEVWQLYRSSWSAQLLDLFLDLSFALNHFEWLDEKKALTAPTHFARQVRAQAAAEAVANL